MPEIKHDFSAGKMNKDLDERIVPNGQYRDAMNIQVRTTSGDSDGEGDAGDPGATSGNISSVFDSMKVDTSKFKKPDLVTKNTGSKALIAKLRAKRAKDPVDMYLNATKKKQEEETTFG